MDSDKLTSVQRTGAVSPRSVTMFSDFAMINFIWIPSFFALELGMNEA
jgi:hypothetical protein